MSEELQAADETPIVPPKKPKRKYQRRRRLIQARAPREARPAVSAPIQAPSAGELSGLSPNDCCDSCYDTGICAISGDVCVHPFKGGLQSSHQMKPDVVRRFNRAKRILRNMKIELRDAAG